MRVAIIGGGISGLSAAWRLREAGLEVVLLEAERRLGGKILSEHSEGFVIEHGPNGFLDSRTAVLELARDVGLGAQLMQANEGAKKRYLYHRGALRPVPTPPANSQLPIRDDARLRRPGAAPLLLRTSPVRGAPP